METATKVLLGALGAVAVYEIAIQSSEFHERHRYWREARAYCDEVGKPLLRVGMRRSFTEPPNGDVTLDLDPAIEHIPGGVWGDERQMPFADKQFGVCFNEHTLEHLFTLEDVERAVQECIRVADYAVLLAPSPNSLYASSFCPTHNLRLWLEQNPKTIRVADNTWRTGLGVTVGDTRYLRSGRIGQAMVVSDNDRPTVVGL